MFIIKTSFKKILKKFKYRASLYFWILYIILLVIFLFKGEKQRNWALVVFPNLLISSVMILVGVVLHASRYILFSNIPMPGLFCKWAEIGYLPLTKNIKVNKTNSFEGDQLLMKSNRGWGELLEYEAKFLPFYNNFGYYDSSPDGWGSNLDATETWGITPAALQSYQFSDNILLKKNLE